VPQAHHPVGHRQHDDHEQPAQDKWPGALGPAGQVGVQEVDRDRAEDRAGQCPAAADGHPDHHQDRFLWQEVVGVEDRLLGDVEHAGQSGDHGRDREDEHLEDVRLVTGKSQTRLVVPDRDQRTTDLRVDQEAAQEKDRDQHRERDEIDPELDAGVGQFQAGDPDPGHIPQSHAHALAVAWLDFDPFDRGAFIPDVQ